jgi:hypothetical protein
MKLVVFVVIDFLLVIPSHAWKSLFSRTTSKLCTPIVHSRAIRNSYMYSNNNHIVRRNFMMHSNNRDDEGDNNDIDGNFQTGNKNIVRSDEIDLKSELTKYLQLRKERVDEDISEEPIIIGGTRGNVILDYVSGSPNKETIITEKPNIFDYSELEKYGFGVRVIYIENDRNLDFFLYPFFSFQPK